MCKAVETLEACELHQSDHLPIDQGVLDLLVENHRKFLRFLERRLGDRALAEEILQNAFVKTLDKGGKLQPGDGAIAWFYRLLRNALIDHYRGREVERRVLSKQADDPTLAFDDEMKNEICGCMKTLLPTLKPEYAEIVQKVDLDELSISDVAKAEGISANNATVRLHRARKALKKQLETSCGTCAEHGCLDCSCGRAGREE